MKNLSKILIGYSKKKVFNFNVPFKHLTRRSYTKSSSYTNDRGPNEITSSECNKHLDVPFRNTENEIPWQKKRDSSAHLV